MSMLVWEQAEGCAAWNVNGFWSRNSVVLLVFDLSAETPCPHFSPADMTLHEETTCKSLFSLLLWRTLALSFECVLFSALHFPEAVKLWVAQWHHSPLAFHWLMFEFQGFWSVVLTSLIHYPFLVEVWKHKHISSCPQKRHFSQEVVKVIWTKSTSVSCTGGWIIMLL